MESGRRVPGCEPRCLRGPSGRGKASGDYSCDGTFGGDCDGGTYGYDSDFDNFGDNYNGGTDDCDGAWSGLSA